MSAVVDFDFEVPQSCEAHEPPEARGLARDEVRLMVATRTNGKLVHARFNELPRFLRAGDLVVVNNSAQIPAAVAATRPDGTALELRLSTPMPDGRWLVELRLGAERFSGGERGRAACAAGGRASRARRPLRRRPPAVGHRARTCRRRSTAISPSTAGRSATATSRGSGRSTPTRTSTPSSPAASSRRARGARSRPS